MPVTATPIGGGGCNTQSADPAGILTPASLAVDCLNRNVFTTVQREEPTKGTPLLARLKSISLPAGQPAIVQHILHTEAGQPVTLTDCVCEEGDSLSSSSAADCAFYVRFTMQEAISFAAACPAIQADAVVVDATTGLVSISLTGEQLQQPGVYSGQFSLMQRGGTPADDAVLLSNLFYVVVNRTLSLVAGSLITSGPPTMAEIRLFLRDTSPAENYLLTNLRFGDDEIAAAIQLPIMQWNETPPPIGPRYSTMDFPHRYHWLIAITGYLFRIAAEQYRANNLQYSAGGTAINDQDKEMPYEAASDRRLAEWKQFMMRTKVSMNMEATWGTVSNFYW